jgi:DNA-binding CsgD family transcriptional regulator
MQTIPLTLQPKYAAFQKMTSGSTIKRKDRRADHTELPFPDIINTCRELQKTVDSLQSLIRMLPDCTMSNSNSREKVAHLLDKTIEMKSESVENQISNLLNILSGIYRQPISQQAETSGYDSESPHPFVDDEALIVGMNREDLKHFNTISFHMGIAPSLLALIILKQAIVKAKDRRSFEDLFLSIEKPSLRAPHLLRRESEVLQLMSKGHSNREIAENLNISERTVKNHITTLMRKLNAQNRTHAVIVAQQYHLV